MPTCWGGGRVSGGGYAYSRDVVAPSARGGAQLAYEQRLGRRLTLGADWVSGRHAAQFRVRPLREPRRLDPQLERGPMQIANQAVVTIDYTLTDDQGAVLDSSSGEEP